MRNLLLLVIAILGISFTSCRKKTTEPEIILPDSIQVEILIQTVNKETTSSDYVEYINSKGETQRDYLEWGQNIYHKTFHVKRGYKYHLEVSIYGGFVKYSEYEYIGEYKSIKYFKYVKQPFGKIRKTFETDGWKWDYVKP